MSGLTVALFLVVLFFAMLVLTRIGRRVGKRRLAADPKSTPAGTSAVEGAVFALTTLLVAFTFAGAATRFNARRELIVREANAIQTAYLRLDLLPPQAQPELREAFRRYLDSRLSVYEKIHDKAAALQALARSNELQLELWRASMAALEQTNDPRAPLLLVPSLNEMIDITTERTVALKTHLPVVIFALLAFLALACAFAAGHGMAKSSSPNRLHTVGFAGLVVLTLAVIIDYEFPRFGLIRIDPVDKLLVDVREGMK